ncbi:MAG TPA: peroxiredoxin [Gammaproteobacteria bacterium]|jgi:peroxiredoxin (alkyl hydroperoxide reductase subunit C)|nr:peroxiredoxin [Gammaproteobacteria bacterium]
MKRHALYLSTLLALIALPAFAAIGVGDKAPDFTAQASLGGKEFTYNLADALKKGPVVLYFYPEAFTKGCTIEAHDFAEATDKYAALGATVIGVSHDHIDKLDKFSVSECRNKFAVAADPDEKVIKAYGAALPGHEAYANRTSYVITPDGKVIYTYTDMNPDQHVANTLKAIQDWKSKQAK